MDDIAFNTEINIYLIYNITEILSQHNVSNKYDNLNHFLEQFVISNEKTIQ